MDFNENSVISLEGLWRGVSIKTLSISPSQNNIFGAGKGSNSIFVFSITSGTLIGMHSYILNNLRFDQGPFRYNKMFKSQ